MHKSSIQWWAVDVVKSVEKKGVGGQFAVSIGQKHRLTIKFLLTKLLLTLDKQ